jgi:hypothetical protein
MKKIMSMLVGFGLLLGPVSLFIQEKQDSPKQEKRGSTKKKDTKGKNQKRKAEEPKAHNALG